MPTCTTSPGWAEGRTLYPTAQMCAAVGVPQLMRIINTVQLTRLGHVARMSDESVIEQLLFAEVLVELGGVVGRPCSTWRAGALAALRPVLTSWLAEWRWYGVALDRAQWRSLCDSAQPAASSPPSYCAEHMCDLVQAFSSWVRSL